MRTIQPITYIVLFLYFSMSTLSHAQKLSSYTDKAKRDSILTAITLAKASQEEHELFMQFQPHFKGDVTINKCIVNLDDINNRVSPLYGVQNVKLGDTYYTVTIPCTEDWYDGELYELYFVRLWILDNHTPASIHFGASEFTYRCSSEIRDTQKLSSIADLTKRDSILTSIVVAQTKKEIPELVTKYNYKFNIAPIIEEHVMDEDKVKFLSNFKDIAHITEGEKYYTVILPYDRSDEDNFFYDYFIKLWVFDSGIPFYISTGAYEIIARCKK